MGVRIRGEREDKRMLCEVGVVFRAREKERFGRFCSWKVIRYFLKKNEI